MTFIITSHVYWGYEDLTINCRITNLNLSYFTTICAMQNYIKSDDELRTGFFLENELKFRDLVTDDHFALPRTIGIIMADGRIRVLTHYSTSLSSLFRCIWKYRTSKKKSVLSIVIHTIYGVVCIQLTHFSCGDRENTRTLSYNHLPLLMVRPWNHVLYSTSFYALSSKMIRCKSFIKTYA